METPILFIIFNRPELTQRVFESIKKVKPKKLFIAADGPRHNKQGEMDICLATRSVTENIDWECEVFRKYEDKNLGCRSGVSSAINWFFQHVEKGVILEDDCLPNQSFFFFCEELLIRYKDKEQVMMISGNNLDFEPTKSDYSYRFSNYSHIWGWSTWKRAWLQYDEKMSSYPQFRKEKTIEKICPDKRSASYWIKLFDKVYEGKIDTWDAQWQYAIFKKKGLCITPAINLVSNIGFGVDATHTISKTVYAELPTEEISHLLHPKSIVQDTETDRRKMVSIIPSLRQKIITMIKKIIT